MAVNPDHVVFGLYLLAVLSVGLLASRQEKESDDYFLASRNLTWWVIGASLIAANISTHHFIGMSGQGFTVGLAIASYEWMAALALIIYGKFFLLYYLKTRITTMPEFLEHRFNHRVRLAFAVISLIGYILIELAVVLYTGSLAIESIFGLPLAWGLALLCTRDAIWCATTAPTRTGTAVSAERQRVGSRGAARARLRSLSRLPLSGRP